MDQKMPTDLAWLFFWFFSLYVEAPFYGTPQDCNWGRLLF
jgi:hypothetical protein